MTLRTFAVLAILFLIAVPMFAQGAAPAPGKPFILPVAFAMALFTFVKAS